MDTSRDAAIRLQHGRQLLNQGRFEEAIKEFTAAEAVRPDDEALYRNRAEAFRQIGRDRHAEFDNEEANKIARARPISVSFDWAPAAGLIVLGFVVVIAAAVIGWFAAPPYGMIWGPSEPLMIAAVCVGIIGVILIPVGFYRLLRELFTR